MVAPLFNDQNENLSQEIFVPFFVLAFYWDNNRNISTCVWLSVFRFNSNFNNFNIEQITLDKEAIMGNVII